MSDAMATLPVRGGQAPALTTTVHADWSSAERLAPEWEALALAAGSDIYTAPTHARVWWSHYGRGSPAIVEIRESGAHGEAGRLVGVVPLFVVRMATPFGVARIARLMGGDSTIVVLSPAVEPDTAAEIWEACIRAMLPRADALCLAPLSGHSGVAEALASAAATAGASNRPLLVLRRDIGVHTTFVLPDTFAGYVESLDKRQRGNLRRDLNQLAKRGELHAEVVASETAGAEFAAFAEMHGRQWLALGKCGHFGDWPGSLAFSDQLTGELARRGQVLLLKLTSDGSTVGYEWCFVQGSKGFWRLPARIVDENWEKLGLGRIGMVKMIEAMIQAGVREIEAGPGRYEYKVKHGAVESPLCSVWIFPDASLARMKMKFLKEFIRLADLLYYRVWFLKLRARLGLGPTSLARWWTRMRL